MNKSRIEIINIIQPYMSKDLSELDWKPPHLYTEYEDEKLLKLLNRSNKI